MTLAMKSKEELGGECGTQTLGRRGRKVQHSSNVLWRNGYEGRWGGDYPFVEVRHSGNVHEGQWSEQHIFHVDVQEPLVVVEIFDMSALTSAQWKILWIVFNLRSQKQVVEVQVPVLLWSTPKEYRRGSGPSDSEGDRRSQCSGS